MPASGFLISCARPAASCPRLASWSTWARRTATSASRWRCRVRSSRSPRWTSAATGSSGSVDARDEPGSLARRGGAQLLFEPRGRAAHRVLDEDRHAGDERQPGAEEPADPPAHHRADLLQRLGEVEAHRGGAARRARLVTARARNSGVQADEAAHPLAGLGVGLDPGLAARALVGEERRTRSCSARSSDRFCAPSGVPSRR